MKWRNNEDKEKITVNNIVLCGSQSSHFT